MISERLKKCEYNDIYGSSYFWRTYDGQEIYLVEEREGRLLGYEFKWSGAGSVKPPRDWHSSYPNSELTTITKENYLDFLL